MARMTENLHRNKSTGCCCSPRLCRPCRTWPTTSWLWSSTSAPRWFWPTSPSWKDGGWRWRRGTWQWRCSTRSFSKSTVWTLLRWYVSLSLYPPMSLTHTLCLSSPGSVTSLCSLFLSGDVVHSHSSLLPPCHLLRLPMVPVQSQLRCSQFKGEKKTKLAAISWTRPTRESSSIRLVHWNIFLLLLFSSSVFQVSGRAEQRCYCELGQNGIQPVELK